MVAADVFRAAKACLLRPTATRPARTRDSIRVSKVSAVRDPLPERLGVTKVRVDLTGQRDVVLVFELRLYLRSVESFIEIDHVLVVRGRHIRSDAERRQPCHVL